MLVMGSGHRNFRVKEFGILLLPIVIMTPFGLFGFRHGQFLKTFGFFVVNGLCIFNYFLSFLVTLGCLFHLTDTSTLTILTFCFRLETQISFSVLLCQLYKTNNIFSLLKDVTNRREKKLNGKEMTYIFIMGILIVAFQIYLNFSVAHVVLEVMQTGKTDVWRFYTLDTNSPLLNKILLLVEIVIYLNTSFVHGPAMGFLISVVTLMLTKEFQKTNEHLELKLKPDGRLSNELLCTTIDRFYKLTKLVHRANQLFSLLLGLILTTSFGMLCAVIYYILTENKHLDLWIAPLILAVINLIILIPPLVSINNEVSVKIAVGVIEDAVW